MLAIIMCVLFFWDSFQLLTNHLVSVASKTEANYSIRYIVLQRGDTLSESVAVIDCLP